MGTKIKLKGNESFSIREGWLTKGIFEVKNNPRVFSQSELTDILGMGSNMVKSLKYWLQTANLIKEFKKNEYELSELGQLVYIYDPYLEDRFTLYFIHLNIVTNCEKAYIWNLFFNKCNFQEFSKKDLVEQIEYLLDTDNLEYNEKMLVDEISVLLKTYVDDEKGGTPENNFTCPLAELSLVNKIGKDKYIKEKPQMNELNELIVYYCILNQLQEKDAINIDDLLKENNSVGKLLNLDKMLLNEYLEILKRKGFIRINRTAGLNMVYTNRKVSAEEIFKKHFGKEHE